MSKVTLVLDSSNPEKIKAVKDKLKVSEENPFVKHTFEDGSVITLEMQIVDINSIITPMGIIEEKSVFLKGYDSYAELSYYSDVSIDANYPNSKIKSIYNQYYDIYLGTISEKDFHIVNKYETSSKAAEAELTCNYTVQIAGQPLKSGLARLELTIKDAEVKGFFSGPTDSYRPDPIVY